MARSSSLVPIKGQPGRFRNRLTGKTIAIVEWREDDKYDTVVVRGRIAPGTTLHFFRDLQGKNPIDTNLSTARRLPAGEEMILDRIGIHIPLAVGDTITAPADIKKVVENGYLAFQINRKDISEGPLVKFPSGYGLTGQTNEEGAGVMSVGVASTAAAAKLIREQTITSEHDLDAKLQFFDRQWMGGGFGVDENETNDPTIGRPVPVRLHLHGLIKAAATK